MTLKAISIEDSIHPMRHNLSDGDIALILQGIADDENWMSLPEIDAATDWLYDYIVAQSQTVEGVLTLQ